jgi:hypothetical protein
MLLVATATWQVQAGQPAVDRGEAPAYTLVGKLVHNTADRNGAAPYVLLDQSGAVRGYLSATSGVPLAAYCGQRVQLEGVADGGARGHHYTIQRIVAAQHPLKTAGAQRSAGGQGVRQTAYQDAGTSPKGPDGGDGKKEASRLVIPTPQPEGPIVDGGAAPDDGPAPDGAVMDEGPGPGGCNGGSCGDDSCGPACDSCRPCFPRLRPRGGFYADVDYLLWWTEGMRVPPLVTSGPSTTQPGYIPPGGAPIGPTTFAVTDPETGAATTTSVLFGNSLLMTSDRSGGRLKLGTWLNCCETVGIEGDYFALSDATAQFRMWSDGNPIISRPFFDTTRPANDPQNVERVAFPRGNAGSLDGAINVDALNKFQGAGVRMRLNCCGGSACDPCGASCRTDFTVGYRFLRIDDALVITEQLTSTDPTALGAFLVQDQFSTRNQFHGCELGFVFQRQQGAWSLDVAPKISLGNTHETADVFGFTRTTAADGSRATAEGGLLALSSNIGQYSRDQFAVVPEIGLKLGYQVTCHLRATFGYDFIYWSRVARAGDQIDFKVNPTLIPNGGPVTGDAAHPQFTFQQSDFWAQGLTWGMEYRW